MKNNEMKKIPLKLNKINNNNGLINTIEKTATRESSKNLIINPAALNPVKEGKKKKRVSFVDQVESKKDIAQIIYFNDKLSLKDDKTAFRQNLFFEQYKKQCTNIDEINKMDNNDDVYRIKRPKKYDYIHNPKNDNVKEQCSCILF